MGSYETRLSGDNRLSGLPQLRIFDVFNRFLALVGCNNIHQPIGCCGACTTTLSKTESAIGQENRIVSETSVMVPFTGCVETVQITL